MVKSENFPFVYHKRNYLFRVLKSANINAFDVKCLQKGIYLIIYKIWTEFYNTQA